MTAGKTLRFRDPVLAPAAAAGQGPLDFLLELARLGEVVQYASPYGPVRAFNHPDHVHQILHRPNFRRTALIKQALGEGLLTSNGPRWLTQRRLMQPRFRQNVVTQFVPTINEVTSAAFDRWQRSADQGQTLDLAAELTRLTLQIVVRTLFSAQIDEEAGVLSGAIAAAIEDLGHIAGTIFGIPLAINPTRNQQFKSAMATMDRFAYELIDRRRRQSPRPDDLLSLLIEAQEKDAGPASGDVQLRDEVVTLLVSGHETTSLSLSWACYLLCRHPAAERRLCRELDEVLQGRLPTADDLPKLCYTRMVLEESMRLYPPVWTMSRQAQLDDQIAGYRVAAGSVVIVSPYVLHRRADCWAEPEWFDPERFSPERTEGGQRRAYLPFSSGQHVCLGNHFAMMEGALILARIYQRFRIQLAVEGPVEPYPVLTLRQRGGLPATLERRSAGISAEPQR
jgi:cytochrome P450